MSKWLLMLAEQKILFGCKTVDMQQFTAMKELVLILRIVFRGSKTYHWFMTRQKSSFVMLALQSLS
jgi:hypothetical protein